MGQDVVSAMPVGHLAPPLKPDGALFGAASRLYAHLTAASTAFRLTARAPPFVCSRVGQGAGTGHTLTLGPHRAGIVNGEYKRQAAHDAGLPEARSAPPGHTGASTVAATG
jgi:hypothetical protein